MTIDMTNFCGKQTSGRDYSVALRDLLPVLIGTTPMTMFQIAEAAGRDHETVRRIIGKVRNQVHIASWSMVYQHPTALYKWGSEPDAPRPVPLSKAEKSRIYRATEYGRKTHIESTARWKNSPAGAEYRKRRLALIKEKRQREKKAQEVLKQIDPLMAAFIKRR
jgi:hypothetical protein